MEKNLSNEEALKKLKELVESINICMYCTMEAGSDMASRPMGTAKIEDNGDIWFFTTDHSGAAENAEEAHEVCLNYSSPAKNSYVCVMGNPELSFDKEKMKELWTPMMKTWFPDGLETPDIALVKVTPRAAHYWESDVTRMRLLFSFLKASVTGEPAKGTEGDHGELKV